MRSLLAPALVALLALPSAAGFTGALDELGPALDARVTTIDGSTKKGRKLVKRLRSAREHLDRPSDSLGDDLQALRGCAGKLRNSFRDDPEFDGLLAGAYDRLASRAHDARDRLAALSGTVGDQKRERKLISAVAGFDKRAMRAAATDRVDRAAKRLRGAWKTVAKAENALGVGRRPDFSLDDTNPHSASFGRSVSPREFLGGGSAYYFGHST